MIEGNVGTADFAIDIGLVLLARLHYIIHCLVSVVGAI